MSPVVGALLLAAEEGGHEEKNPLIPNLNELVWGTICFAIFAGFLIKYVLPRARQVMEERTRGIEGKLAQAEKDRAEAQQLLEKYRQQLAEAREEAGRIRNDAQTQRAEIVEEARNEARAEAQRISTAATSQIASERQQALTELRREVGTLAVDLAGRIVGESLEDDARQRGTVDRYLAQLEDAAARTPSTPAGASA